MCNFSKLNLRDGQELYKCAKALADVVVPQVWLVLFWLLHLKVEVTRLYTVRHILAFYTFKLHCRSLLVNMLQLILNVRQLWRHFRRIRRCPKKKLLDADDVTTWLFWMYNKTIIGFGLRIISRIIQSSFWVILDIMLSLIYCLCLGVRYNQRGEIGYFAKNLSTSL